MNRPLVLFAAALAAGILIAFYSSSYLLVISVMLLQAVLLLVFPRKKRKQLLIFVVGMLFYMVGSFEFLLVKNINESRFEAFAGEPAILKGFIASEAGIKGPKVSYIVDVREIVQKGESKKIKGKIILNTLKDDQSCFYGYGSGVEIDGTLEIPKGRRNPGGFDYRTYLTQSGISASVFARGWDIRSGPAGSTGFFTRAGLAARKSIVNVIYKTLPEEQAGLLAGMLIGYRKGLPEDVQQVFRDSGLSHLMAVSGANIVFVAAPFVFLFKKLRVRHIAANVIIMGILVFFVFITGFEPSVVRAVIMAIVLLLGQILKREADIYTSIAFAAILLLLYNPYTLFNIGFQLSFAATLSLVLFYKNIKEMVSFRFLPGIVSDTLAATLAAQLGVLPLSTVYFNTISLVSVLSNIVVVPAAGVITILGMLMAVLGQFSIFISRIIGYINCAFLSFVLYAAKAAASLPYAAVRVITPTMAAIILYYLLLLFFLWYRPKYGIRLKIRYIGAAAAVLAVALCISALLPGKLQVVFLDVGAGDAIFIRTGSGKTVLVDGGGGGQGPGSGPNMGDSVVLPFLLDAGTAQLDLMVSTHGHDDHIQGLYPILEDFPVKSLVVPDAAGDAGYKKLMGISEKKGIPVYRCGRGDRLKLDDRVYMEVLHPVKGAPVDKSSFNNSSLVLKLYFGDVELLLCGDIEKDAEELMLTDNVDVRADVLKVAHHGSDTSTTPAFLRRISPKAAVISTGRNNFGHPSSSVLDRLENIGAKLFRTDTCGAVILKTDGKRIEIKKTVSNRGSG